MVVKKAKYRIQKVSIEGFRGFTRPQTVEIGGRNLFVFGLNGRGKSSIIEAIRWCLFGAPPGGDIEVRNTFYKSQECRVSLVLEGGGQCLTVLREFRPGHDRSRQIIKDKTGNTLTARDALPQLARLGHHESAQVIFAAQHASGRQIPADISDFKTVLCFYLRLEEVPKLLASLHDLYEERMQESEIFSKALENIEFEYREKLKQIEAQLATIRANPPWGEADLPTGSETDEKIKGFALQAARLVGQQVPADKTMTQLLIQAQQWIELAASRGAVEREGRRNTLRTQIAQADIFLSTYRQGKVEIDTMGAKRSEVERSLKEITDIESDESLHLRLASLEKAKTEHEERVRVAQTAKKFVEMYPTNSCPACGTAIDGPVLLQSIHSQCANPTGDVNALDELRNLVVNLDRFKSELEALNKAIDAKTKTQDSTKNNFAKLLGVDSSLLHSDMLEARVAEFKGNLEVLNGQLADGESIKQKDLKKIKELHQELNYHELRGNMNALRAKLSEGMMDARDLLKDYRDLLSRLDEVKVLINESFREALDKAIPVLDDTFTKVYTRLTEQLSYDLVRIHHDPDRTGNLELRVASSGLPGQTFPANVLNGQAYKALHLVPYFVFSRLQSEVMELDLLLIDDPSESFDTSHVELLIQELADAAHHAQIVVASHEREKFSPHFDTYFHVEPYAVINVNHFDRNDGPRLEQT